MTYEDYRKQMNLLKEEMREVASKMRTLKKKFAEELPFKKGDKVEFVYGEIGWVKDIIVSDYGNLEISYYPPKKNGEKSGKYLCIWCLRMEDIKLIQHADLHED